jgi:hypothetical protein
MQGHATTEAVWVCNRLYSVGFSGLELAGTILLVQTAMNITRVSKLGKHMRVKTIFGEGRHGWVGRPYILPYMINPPLTHRHL